MGLELFSEAHEDSGHAYRVAARGEIDLATVSVLTAEFDSLSVEGATLVVFDASAVDFVDSSGLSAIIDAATALEARGGLFLIEGMSPAMQRVLEVTGLLERYRSDGEAGTPS